MTTPVKMVRIDGKLVIVPVTDPPPKQKKADAVGPATIKATPTKAANGLKKKKVTPVAPTEGTPSKVATKARTSLRSKKAAATPPAKQQLPRSVTPSAALRSGRPATDRKTVRPALRRSLSVGRSVPSTGRTATLTPKRVTRAVSVGRSAPSSGRMATPALGRVARAVSGPLHLKSMELAEYKLPDRPEPPPRIRELEILTTRDLEAIMSGDDRKKNTISDYLACDLTREVSDEALEFLVQKAPGMRTVSLYNCHELREILCLRKLLKVEVLYLGELPGVETSIVKRLLAQDKKGTWSQLRDVYLAGMPLTDDCLESLSRIATLTRLNVSNCLLLTSQGLGYLEKNSPALTRLEIEFCPLIDPFAKEKFRISRQKITTFITGPTDSRIMEGALAEANERVKAGDIRKEWIFFPSGNKREGGLAFYRKMFALTGYPMPEDVSLQHLELALQAYKAHCDAAAAFCKELEKQGHFWKGGDEKIPRSVPEALVLASMAVSRNLKVRTLDFSYSGLPFFPSCFANLTWPKLETIDFRGTHVKNMASLPRDLLEKCPVLTLIRFEGCDQKFQRRK